jgi:DNA-binding NtrC family response regulator
MSDTLTGKPQLVLIDDDPGVLRALSLLVTALGFNVKPFQQALDAVSYISNSPSEISLIVCDLRMPEHSGAWVLERIRSERLDLPIIIMSGHATTEERKLLERGGASGFIAKPFNPGEFLRLASSVTKPPRDKSSYSDPELAQCDPHQLGGRVLSHETTTACIIDNDPPTTHNRGLE